jgi:hypothetical protein
VPRYAAGEKKAPLNPERVAQNLIFSGSLHGKENVCDVMLVQENEGKGCGVSGKNRLKTVSGDIFLPPPVNICMLSLTHNPAETPFMRA